MADDLIGTNWRSAQEEAVVSSCRCFLGGASWSRCATSCARRTSTTPRNRPSRQQEIPADLDPALRAVADHRRHLQRSATSRRWDRSAAASAATFRSSTTFPDTPNLLTPNPRRGQPRADDPRPVSSRPPSSTCSPAPGFSSWCTTGSCTSARRPRSPTSRACRATTAASDIRVPRTVPDAVAGRLDAAAGLRQPEQPLVGRVADLRIRRRHGRASCAPRSAASCGSNRPACCQSIRRPASTSPASPTTGGSAWRCSTPCSRRSTTTSATCSRTSIRTGTTTSCSRKARLINSALMAKIHTVEWTPAILPHPVIKTGDARQLVRPRRRRASGRRSSSSTTANCSAASSARSTITTASPTRSPRSSSPSTACTR